MPFRSCFKRTQSAAFSPNCTKKKDRNTSNPSLPNPHSKKIAIQSTVLSLGAISFLFAMGIGGETVGCVYFPAGRKLGDVEFMRWCQILLYGGGHCFPELVENGHLGKSEEVEGKRNLFIFFFFFRGKEMMHEIYSNGRATGNFSRKYKAEKDLLLACPNARFAFSISQQFGFFYFSADLNLLFRENAVR